jgi:hypothetical protein
VREGARVADAGSDVRRGGGCPRPRGRGQPARSRVRDRAGRRAGRRGVKAVFRVADTYGVEITPGHPESAGLQARRGVEGVGGDECTNADAVGTVQSSVTAGHLDRGDTGVRGERRRGGNRLARSVRPSSRVATTGPTPSTSGSQLPCPATVRHLGGELGEAPRRRSGRCRRSRGR